VYRYRNGSKRFCRLTERLEPGDFLVVPTREFFETTPVAPPAGDVYESLRTGSGAVAAEARLAEERRRDVHLSGKMRQEALDWVLFKNQYVICINKPSGVPVMRSADGGLNLTDLLPAWRFTQNYRPLVCNHLDQETSGIVVLARTHDTHRMLAKMFSKRAVPNSVYWGFCVGTPKAISGRLKMHLETPAAGGRDGRHSGVVIARPAPTPESKVAVAEFVVNASAAEYASFISFYPLTSRRHQLRIMAAHALRCPIVGDAKFGGDTAFPENLDALLGNVSGDPVNRMNTKMHLHHRKLQLPYKKRNGEFECISAPMPEHMKATFKRLGWASNLDDPLIPG
jgi:23S rRNA-/tRNA-specific pseudouridylate synthase